MPGLGIEPSSLEFLGLITSPFGVAAQHDSVCYRCTTQALFVGKSASYCHLYGQTRKAHVMGAGGIARVAILPRYCMEVPSYLCTYLGT